MNEAKLNELLHGLKGGDLTVDEVVTVLRQATTIDIGEACLDHHRALRCGFPEVIFGAGKTTDQIVSIMHNFVEREANVLVTRLEADRAAAVRAEFPAATYQTAARTLTLIADPPDPREGSIGVITAGTSDQAVGAEAAETLRFLGYDPDFIQDVGVAGIHRLLRHQESLQRFQVIIVVAGMEGALPSVVGGLVAAPVIAVPTSVGYGANLDGLTALLAMVNSCASGITVTNIDNGFGAACAAARILSLIQGQLRQPLPGSAATSGVQL